MLFTVNLARLGLQLFFIVRWDVVAGNSITVIFLVAYCHKLQTVYLVVSSLKLTTVLWLIGYNRIPD